MYSRLIYLFATLACMTSERKSDAAPNAKTLNTVCTQIVPSLEQPTSIPTMDATRIIKSTKAFVGFCVRNNAQRAVWLAVEGIQTH